MKALVYYKYGSPKMLSLQEVEIPTPKDNEVRIKIRAASINSWDWDLLRGEPFVVRLAGGGLSKPKKKILGCDVAGQVEALGKNVTRFKIGDAVFGDLSEGGWGGFAEYVCGQEDALQIKPSSLTFEEAASLPQAAVMALQGVRDYGKVKPGHKVLINGGGGGVGSFAIQMAKMVGAVVTAVDRGNKFEMMRSLGADNVVDYMKEDFTKMGIQYDYILDVVGHHTIYDFKRVLKSKGIYRMIGGPTKLIFQSIFVAPLITMFNNKIMGILAHQPNKNLNLILEMIVEGQLKPIIDTRFELKHAADAMQYFGEGQAQGKVIITM